MGGRPLCPKLMTIQSILCCSDLKMSQHEDVYEERANLFEEMVHYICCYTFCSLECNFIGSCKQASFITTLSLDGLFKEVKALTE